MLGSGARPVATVCGRLAGRVGTAGVHAAVGGWARAVGRAPEPLDDRWRPDDIGVDPGNGGRVLRRPPRGRLLQLAHGPVGAAATGLLARAWGGRGARAGACYDSTRAVLDDYRDYLCAERGLAASTVELNVRMVRPFLTEQLRADGELDLHQLSAREVGAFVVAQSRKRPRSVGRIVTALRSLLGFLHVDGVIDRPLAAAVPSVAGWSLSTLPKALGSDQVAALLTSCNRNTSTGRPGLRDPHAASPTRVAGRGGGGAEPRRYRLAPRRDYRARQGQPARPAATARRCRPGHRRVFAACSPRRGAWADGLRLGARTIPGIELHRRDHGRRQRLATGGHRSHWCSPAAATTATTMLHAGGSLTEIGQVLRHRRVLTTAIYAKVDRHALRLVARPWPGDAV